jgi:hypothetical protein
MSKLLATLTAGLLLSSMAAAAPQSAYQPLAFLAGHCWKGEFPGGKATDEHCFSWVYGGQFLRDQHTVRRDGQPDALGETIYFWDAGTQRLRYLYVESGGGHSLGGVTQDGDNLVFPETALVESGQQQVYRSRWLRSGDEAYDVVTDFKMQDRWAPGFKIHMQRQAAR